MSNDLRMPMPSAIGRKSFVPSDAFRMDELSALQVRDGLTFYNETANRALLVYLRGNEGYFGSDPQYDCVYVTDTNKGTAIIRTDLLKWQMSNDKRWWDFPRFLMRHVVTEEDQKTREYVDWLAKSLVQAAYIGDWACVGQLINHARGMPCTL